MCYLLSGSVECAGGAGGDAMCATLFAGGLEVLDVTHYVLPCLPEVLDVMRCVLFHLLEVLKVLRVLGVLEVLEVLDVFASRR